MTAGLDNLRHIIVLMMENRSFDHMLGGLKKQDSRINGLTGNDLWSNKAKRDVLVSAAQGYLGKQSQPAGVNATAAALDPRLENDLDELQRLGLTFGRKPSGDGPSASMDLPRRHRRLAGDRMRRFDGSAIPVRRAEQDFRRALDHQTAGAAEVGEAMPKNIVICCDGTGNEFSDHNSNVVKLYSALVIDGKTQIGYYHPGVGTMGAPTATNWVSKTWSTLMGLAFGAGLLTNVGDAYRYLMENYQDGDQVYLFGFSRGAYTARALAGLLHMFGLLYPGNDGLIPYILRMYAKRTRDAAGMTHTFAVAAGFKDTFCRHCPPHLVGVWDTVSSVGYIWDPVRLPYTGQNPDMKNGRHAVSIDERRCYFRNNLWGAVLPGQTLKQVWFAGVHSDVGGSYPEAESGLSKIALEWMLCEAVSLGLLVDPVRADYILGRTQAATPPPPPVPPDPRGMLHNSLTPLWWLLEFFPHKYYNVKTKKLRWRIPLGARRALPDGSLLHATVKDKLQLDKNYQPTNLPPEPWPEEPRNACRF